MHNKLVQSVLYPLSPFMQYAAQMVPLPLGSCGGLMSALEKLLALDLAWWTLSK